MQFQSQTKIVRFAASEEFSSDRTVFSYFLNRRIDLTFGHYVVILFGKILKIEKFESNEKGKNYYLQKILRNYLCH